MGRVGLTLLTRLDIMMVAAFLDFATTGMYAIFVAITNIVLIPHIAFSSVVAPLVAQASKNKDFANIKDLYQRTSLNHLVGSALLFICIIVNIENLLMLMDKMEYQNGIVICWCLGIAQMLAVAFGINGIILVNSPYYRLDLLVKLGMGILAFVLNYLLIPQMGYIGAALGTAIVIIGINVILTAFIYHKMRIHPFSGKMLVLALIVTALCCFNFYVLPSLDNIILDSLYRTLILSLLFLGLIFQFKIAPDINALAKDVWGRIMRK